MGYVTGVLLERALYLLLKCPLIAEELHVTLSRTRTTEAKLKTNACVLRRVVAAGDKRGTGLMRLSFSRRVPVAELLGHPVYEHSQARRQLPRMGVEDVDRQRRRWKAGEHFDQRAAGKLGADAISRHLNQSEAHARARNVGLWTGHRHHRWQRDLTRLAARAEDERNDFAGVRRKQSDHLMTCEVVRRSRHAETAEIIRAGEGPPVEQREAPLDQRTVAQLAGPKDAVESLPDHVQRLVRFAEVQPDIGILLPESSQAR